MLTLIGQRPQGRVGIAVLSDGGGHATIAVDDLHSYGVRPAQLQPATIAGLRELLGPAAAVANPIDLAGAADRDPHVFVRTLALLASDPGVGAVLLVGLFGGYAIRFSDSLLDAEIDAARRLSEVAREAGTPLVVHTLYANSGSEPIRILRDAGVPVLGSLELASRCVVAMAERGDALDRLDRRPIDWPSHTAAATADPFTDTRAERRTVLLETEARSIAESFDVPLVPAEFCRTPADVAAAAARIGGPVAIRVVSPAAPHKTEAGGVALNVAAADAEATAGRVIEAVTGWAAANGVHADIRGVLVSPMLDAPVAELLVGIVRDPQFGPVLTIGAGGTHVELHRDTATRVLPVDAVDIAGMLDALRIAPLLAGHRGGAPAHVPAIIAAVLALTRCALSVPAIAEIEVNPLFARSDRATAVDVRIFID